jgi:hypothetical protein
MSTPQRDAIANPATGLVIYNLEDSLPQFWNGVCWMPFYLRNCGDCDFRARLTPMADTIDRTQRLFSEVDIDITQTFGPNTPIPAVIVGNLPLGVTATFTGNPSNGSGTIRLRLEVTPFTPAGTFPIIIQLSCGTVIQSLVFTLTLEPCYQLSVLNSINNYNVATDLYATHPSAPTTQPVCVVTTIAPGVLVSSPTATQPAFTTGNLPSGSVVGIVNDGNIIARGGDGGQGFLVNLTGCGGLYQAGGFNGGDAIRLTATTSLLNNGHVFGGGGGGGSAAVVLCASFNVIGFNVSLGFATGGGGGGGPALGQGGNPTFTVGFVAYAPGTNASGGVNGTPGFGGNYNIPFNLGPATITPAAIGGNGGPYGLQGQDGQLAIFLSICFNIPFIGNVCPINQNLFSFFGIPQPALPGGQGGFAVRRNGFTLTNLPDANYQTQFLRGRVGN